MTGVSEKVAPVSPKRVSLALFACLQNALVGGVIYGWASIAGTLLVASIEDGGANLSLQDSTKIFSIASSLSMVSCLFLGLVLDHLGPRICSVLSNVIVAIGCQIVSLATSKSQYAWGLCLIAFGGPGIPTSIVHVTNLFPKQKFFVMSVINGSISLSFSVLALFEWLWAQYGIGIHTLFGWYTIVVMASTLASLLFWPNTPFEDKEVDDETATFNDATTVMNEHLTPEHEFVEATTKHLHLTEQPLNSLLREAGHNLERSKSFIYSRKALAKGHNELVSLKDQTFWNQVLNGMYVRNLLLFVATSFFANFYVASITTELADGNHFPNEHQHRLERDCTYAMSWLGLVGSMLAGLLMDNLGLELCTAFTLMLGQLHALMLVIWSDSFGVLLISFVIYTMFRQFLFPVFIATLTARLGYKYFGILAGIGFAVSGIAQFPMEWIVQALQGDCHEMVDRGVSGCSHGWWEQWHLLQVALFSLLLFVPLIDYKEDQRTQTRVSHLLDTPQPQRLLYGSSERC